MIFLDKSETLYAILHNNCYDGSKNKNKNQLIFCFDFLFYFWGFIS